MDQTTISMLMALIGCAIGISGWVRTGKKDDAAITAVLTRLETQVDDLISARNESKQIAEQLNKLSVKMDTTCNTLSRLESQITNINGIINTMNADMVRLTMKCEASWGKIDDHTKRISELEKKVAELEKMD